METIEAIRLKLPYTLGYANSYLINTGAGFTLIDTGAANRRIFLENRLRAAGCQPGNLKLIILTHGDFDHSGNAAYLRQTFGAKTGMHRGDSGMVEQRNIFFNRHRGNRFSRVIAAALFGFRRADVFSPDIYLEEGDDLLAYGLDARVIYIPGHSKGSIAVLTASGALFCGDLVVNGGKPFINSLIDDREEAAASVRKMRGLAGVTVYPGHGSPFPVGQIPDI